MRKPVEGLCDKRRCEILDACDKLYREKDFSQISIKDISVETSFSRPSIYNYYQTKEEIFLGLLTREYELWTEDLQKINETDTALSVDAFASAVARSLEKRVTLLKISAMNLYEIEDKSSLERLVAFKNSFRNAVDMMMSCIDVNFPDEKEKKKQLIQSMFFPFMYGIYPYTAPTEKQKEAMAEAGIEYRCLSVYEMACQCLKTILNQ